MDRPKRNTHCGVQFTRRLKVLPIASPYFSITGWKSEALGSERVAPGMEVAFLLRFKPEERIDYAYDLVCVSERETFLVPIRATGARGNLLLAVMEILGKSPLYSFSFHKKSAPGLS
jgi:hydrocephalus-inducing protein